MFPVGFQMPFSYLKKNPENCAVLGYDAASGGNFLPTFRDSLLVPSSGVYSRGSQRVCLGTLVCREISGLCREKMYWESADT
jgi:hypothetical protein